VVATRELLVNPRFLPKSSTPKGTALKKKGGACKSFKDLAKKYWKRGREMVPGLELMVSAKA